MSIDTSVGRVEYVSRVSECRLTPVSKCLARAQLGCRCLSQEGRRSVEVWCSVVSADVRWAASGPPER